MTVPSDAIPTRPPGSASPAALAVDLTDATGRLTQTQCAWLLDRMAAAFALACQRAAGSGPARGGQVHVRVVDDREMAAAHLDYAGVEGTTDVLTFDMSVDEPDPEHSGRPGDLEVDILLCLDEAQRQADQRRAAMDVPHAREHELLLYALHGVLHCLGHDDHDPQSFERMHTEEDRVLEEIGVGARFAPGRPASTREGGAS